MASVNVKFTKKVTKEEIINAWNNFKNPLKDLSLPSSPNEFLKYYEDENRPQTNLDRGFGNGM